MYKLVTLDNPLAASFYEAFTFSIKRQAANPEISQAIWTVPFLYSSMINFVKRRMVN